MVDIHENLVGGERRPARTGGVFEVHAPETARGGPPPSLGAWPRSGSQDVEDAVRAAHAAAQPWRAERGAGRREILERLAASLAADPDPGGRLAVRLGLDPGELAELLAPLGERLERALEDPLVPFSDARIAEPGIALLAPAWCELLAGPAAAVLAALSHGRTVLLVSDPLAPMIGDAIASAAVSAGLPPGVLAVLHGAGDDGIRAALGARAASFVVVSGPPSRIRRIRRLAVGGARPAFGAGVGGGDRPVVLLRELRSGTAQIGASEDPARGAARIARGAFGRTSCLSGQLPGQIARVLCPQRAFSRFTEALLAELRGSPDVERPAPFVDPESEADLRRARLLGQDEGATLIFDGEDLLIPAAGDEQAGLERPPEDAEDVVPGPTVFTNVESGMRLAALRQPMPLLCLLRVEGDEDAAALARTLEQEADGSGEPERARPGAAGGGRDRGELGTKGWRGGPGRDDEPPSRASRSMIHLR